jgi:hypothetical protein
MSPFGNHLNCPFWIMLIVSMPWIVRVADQKERKPWLARTRRLIRAVVLLHDVVQVLDGSIAAPARQFVTLPQLGDDLRIRRIPVHMITRGRGCPGDLKAFLQEPLCGSCIQSSRQWKARY